MTFSTCSALRFSHIPRLISPLNQLNLTLPLAIRRKFQHGYGKIRLLCSKSDKTEAVLSEIADQRRYPKVGAQSTGPIPPSQLIRVVEDAGAKVVMDAVTKPKNITYKVLADLVTDTNKMSESAILKMVKNNFEDNLILREEGRIIGDSSSDYLWCIDPLDLFPLGSIINFAV